MPVQSGVAFNMVPKMRRSTRRNLYRVAEEASDDNVKTVGNALAALYDHSLSDVVRVNEVSLGIKGRVSTHSCFRCSKHILLLDSYILR